MSNPRPIGAGFPRRGIELCCLVLLWLAACSVATAAEPVQHFTVRSSDGLNTLEWQNPSTGQYHHAILRFAEGLTPPATTADGAAVPCWSPPGSPDAFTLGGYSSCQHVVSNGTTYAYSVFVEDGAKALSSPVSASGTPFDSTAGPVRWAYSTGTSALQPPGLLPGPIAAGAGYVVSNDRAVHALNPTADGGDWPRSPPFSWTPFSMNQPAMHRPPVAPLSNGPVLFLVASGGDHHVYAVDAYTGDPLWNGDLGVELLAGPAGLFSDIFGSNDVLFVGTHNAGSANTLLALDPTNAGSVIASFTSTPALGAINGIAVDYRSDGRVLAYLTTHAIVGGSTHTVWCVELDDTPPPTLSVVWSAVVGNVDGAPSLADGRVYVGDLDGVVHAFDADDGANPASYSTGDGAVKASVWPDATTGRLYLSTSSTVWALADSGTGITSDWSSSVIPSPSAPVLDGASGALLVGSSDGRLYQLDVATGAIDTSVQLEPAASAIGIPALDVVSDLAYVGSESGRIYGVEAPLTTAKDEQFAPAATIDPTFGADVAVGDPALDFCVKVLPLALPPAPEEAADGIRARDTIALALHAYFTTEVKGDHLLGLQLVTPRGFHYQTLAAPISDDPLAAGTTRQVTGYLHALPVQVYQRASSSRLRAAAVLTTPVSGTAIVSSALYGEWEIEVFLDHQPMPCKIRNAFVLSE